MNDPHRISRRDVLKLGGLALGLAAAPTLAACGGTQGPSATPGSEASLGPASGTVKFQGWDFESQLVQQNVDRFMQLHPAIKVEYTPITSAQYVQKMVAEYTAGSQPDALYVYDDSLAGWVTAGYVQPIDGLPGVDKVYDGIYKSVAQTMSYQGKRYGLPYYTDSTCLIYNAEILGKAGITTAPRTLEELVQQAQKIKSAGLLPYPIGLPAQLSDTWWSWFWGLVFGSGGTLFDSANKPVMNSSDRIPKQILSWLQDATTRSRVIDPASLQMLPVPVDSAFMAGQYAYTIGARYAARKYNNPAQSKIAGKVKIGVVPNLDGKAEGTVSNTRMYSLAKDTRAKGAAWALLSYLGGYDEEGQAYTAKFWFQQQGLGFAFKDLANDPDVKALISQFADPAVYAHLADVAKPRTVISEPWYTQYETSMQKVIQQVMTSQMTPSAGVKTMADTAANLKKQYA
jgi:multiple sugar transport system substrate-binding protein